MFPTTPFRRHLNFDPPCQLRYLVDMYRWLLILSYYSAPYFWFDVSISVLPRKPVRILKASHVIFTGLLGRGVTAIPLSSHA